MSDRKLTLGMEPSERRALEIMRIATEQSDEIASLQRALDDMTERCRGAESRVREAMGAENSRLRAALQRIRNTLHAHNRPDSPIKNNERIRMRDIADLALEQS